MSGADERAVTLKATPSPALRVIKVASPRSAAVSAAMSASASASASVSSVPITPLVVGASGGSDVMEALPPSAGGGTRRFGLLGPAGRAGMAGVERSLWISAALTAALAALAAVRRHTGGRLEVGFLGVALVLLEVGLGALVLGVGGGRYLARAWQSLLHGRIDRYTLLGTGLVATFLHGAISAWAPPALLTPPTGGPPVHALPSLALTGAMLTLLLLGDWLERCEGLSIIAPPPVNPDTGPSLARAPFVPAINQLSRYLLWAAVAVAVASFAAWAVWGPEPRAGHSLMNGLAALLAACPAALGLVAPLAVRAAMDRSNQAGIFFRGVEAIELLRRVDTLVIDARNPLHQLAGVDPEAVRDLNREGMRVILLTADDRMDGEAAARRLAIEDVRTVVSYPERVDEIRRLRAGGRTVALLCDTDDDTLLPREAHLVVAAGNYDRGPCASASLRIESGRLADLVRARRISKATVANIKENISFTFVSSILAVPLAAGLLYPLQGQHVGPMAAAVAAAASAAAVILNSLRLRHSGF